MRAKIQVFLALGLLIAGCNNSGDSAAKSDAGGETATKSEPSADGGTAAAEGEEGKPGDGENTGSEPQPDAGMSQEEHDAGVLYGCPVRPLTDAVDWTAGGCEIEINDKYFSIQINHQEPNPIPECLSMLDQYCSCECWCAEDFAWPYMCDADAGRYLCNYVRSVFANDLEILDMATQEDVNAIAANACLNLAESWLGCRDARLYACHRSFYVGGDTVVEKLVIDGKAYDVEVDGGLVFPADE